MLTLCLFLALLAGFNAQTDPNELHFSVFFTENSLKDQNRSYAVINGSTTERFVYNPKSFTAGLHPILFGVNPDVLALWVYWETNYTSGLRTALWGDVSVHSSRPLDVSGKFNNLESQTSYPIGSEPMLSYLNFTCLKDNSEASWSTMTVSGSYFSKITEKLPFSFSFIKICSLTGIPVVDYSIIPAGLLALIALVLGLSSSPLLNSKVDASELEINFFFASFFIVFVSTSLIFIYTLKDPAIYFFSFIFAVLGWFSLNELYGMLIRLFRRLIGSHGSLHPLFKVPISGQCDSADLFAAIISTVTLALYFLTRHLLFSNIITFSMAIIPLRLPLVQSFGISWFILLLCCLFDAIWNYLLPLFIEITLMHFITIDLPIPLEFLFPWLVDSPIHKCSRVSIMTVIVPGIVLSYLHKFGQVRDSSVYFYAGLSSYCLALALGMTHMLIAQRTYPFFFYIFPLMSVSVLFLGVKRGETRSLCSRLAGLEEKQREESHGKGTSQEGTHKLHFDDDEEGKEQRETELVSQKSLEIIQDSTEI